MVVRGGMRKEFHFVSVGKKARQGKGCRKSAESAISLLNFRSHVPDLTFQISDLRSFGVLSVGRREECQARCFAEYLDCEIESAAGDKNGHCNYDKPPKRASIGWKGAAGKREECRASSPDWSPTNR